MALIQDNFKKFFQTYFVSNTYVFVSTGLFRAKSDDRQSKNKVIIQADFPQTIQKQFTELL